MARSHILYKQTHTLSCWRSKIGWAPGSISTTDLLFIDEYLYTIVKRLRFECEHLLLEPCAGCLRPQETSFHPGVC